MSDKRFKSLDDLCSLLVDERNLACRDRDELKRFLSRTNYYRFSGYAREFQIDPRYGDDRFIGGASFEEIREIAEIDSKMRALLLEQLKTRSPPKGRHLSSASNGRPSRRFCIHFAC